MQVTLVCDSCGVEADASAESDVKTHSVKLDKSRPLEREYCTECWAQVLAVVTPARGGG